MTCGTSNTIDISETSCYVNFPAYKYVICENCEHVTKVIGNGSSDIGQCPLCGVLGKYNSDPPEPYSSYKEAYDYEGNATVHRLIPFTNDNGEKIIYR